MNPEYSEIALIVKDAIQPLKDELVKLNNQLTKMSEDYVRKDVYRAEQTHLTNQIAELKRAQEDMEVRMLGGPQRAILFISSLVGLLLSIIALLQLFLA